MFNEKDIYICKWLKLSNLYFVDDNLLEKPESSIGNQSNKGKDGLKPRLLRPLLPRERTFIDRFVDALVGDGPNKRYALICQECAAHNGMALQEEFEYLGVTYYCYYYYCCWLNYVIIIIICCIKILIKFEFIFAAFHCCYCNHFNPAHSIRSKTLNLSKSDLTPIMEAKTSSIRDDESLSKDLDLDTSCPNPIGDHHKSNLSVSLSNVKLDNDDLLLLAETPMTKKIDHSVINRTNHINSGHGDGLDHF